MYIFDYEQTNIYQLCTYKKRKKIITMNEKNKIKLTHLSYTTSVFGKTLAIFCFGCLLQSASIPKKFGSKPLVPCNKKGSQSWCE